MGGDFPSLGNLDLPEGLQVEELLQALLDEVVQRREDQQQNQKKIPRAPRTNLSHLSPLLAEAENFFAEDMYWPKEDAPTRGKQFQTYQRFRGFERAHKKWTRYHCDEGYPTFFSILCAEPRLDIFRLDKVYPFKLANSSFPKDLIEEAYKTLKSEKLRTTYLQFLKIFQEFYVDVADPEYRTSLDEAHEAHQYIEKNQILLSCISGGHPNWGVMHEMGINLLSIGRIKSGDNAEKLARLSQRKPKPPGSILSIIRSQVRLALSSSGTLAEYKLFAEIYPPSLPPKENDLIKKYRNLWTKCNFQPADFEILLSAEPVEKMISKWDDTLNQHGDWAKNLPPNPDTFYHLLDLPPPPSLSPATGTSFRDLLFAKFKTLPKTPEVNAAYTVLRNPTDKADYDWMLTCHPTVAKVVPLLESFRQLRDDLLKILVEKLANGIPPEECLRQIHP